MKYLRFIILAFPLALLLALSTTHKDQPETEVVQPGTANQPLKREVSSASRTIVYCSPAFDPATLNAANAPIFEGLGNLHYPINTSSALAQQYFDQGLTLIYAFNHGEAGRSFKAAIRHDSTSSMAYWGLAMVLGPNYNAGLNPASLDEINEAINKALLYANNARPEHRALIDAVRARFPLKEVKDMTPFNAAYAAAMKIAHQRFPADINIAALYVDAMMNEHPWNLWLKNGKPQPWTPVIVETLEKLLAKAPTHVGANHMYIHLMEASSEASKAIVAADRLRDMLPAAGHLVHMPSHIDIRTGAYHKGVLANEKATLADSNYITQCKVQGMYPMAYYPHNIHFLAACAFMEGNSRKAIDAAWSVSRHADTTYLHEYAAIQHYYIMPYYVLVRTGKWNEVLTLPKPDASLKYANAIWHYARGMAFIKAGKLNNGYKELAAIHHINLDSTLNSMLIWDINSAGQLTKIAALILEGELLAANGNYDKAIRLLRDATNIEDSLMYQEPPDWFFSTRHNLGHMLLQAKRFADAAIVYQEDLKMYPENGWALMGLYKSLLGQRKTQEAKGVKKRFDNAWKWADIEITSSRI